MKILIYDIETLLYMFYLHIYIPETDEHISFEIRKNKNDLLRLVDFMTSHSDYYWVGYNNLEFDAQILEWIKRTRMHMDYDTPAEEATRKIYNKAMEIIENTSYDIPVDFAEDELTNLQIDLYRIWNFNNRARKMSLKAIEFSICFENIEEMPVEPNAILNGEEDFQTIRKYCLNDVMATYSLYKITIGDTNIPIYKNKNKIEDRAIITKEFGLQCLNYSDVKIGAEWNKKDYLKLTHVSASSLKPDKINYPFGKKFREFFANTVEFKTDVVKNAIKEMANTFVTNKVQDFKIVLSNDLTVVLGKGGIHSKESARFIKPSVREIYYQCDIGSQYPNAIRKYKIEPKHLPGWNDIIVSKIERRLQYKKLARETKDNKYESMQMMAKNALNGGCYGRMIMKGDWQQDPSSALKITIGCQLEILMIIETLILKKFRVISVNTDGFDVIIPREKDEELKETLRYFEKKIGNEHLGRFEYTEFKWIAQTSVNDYIALKSNNETKLKGDFEIDKEIYKNTSMRIVPVALYNYFIKGEYIHNTVMNHKNIYDFCIRKKSSKDFHYEGIKDNKTSIYNKLIRYYVSKKGEKLYRVKNETSLSNAPNRSQVEPGYKCNVCNYLPSSTKVEDCDINYEYYIEKAESILVRIVKSYKRYKERHQLSLFS